MIHIHRSLGTIFEIFDTKTGISVRIEGTHNHLSWREEGPELLDISITNYCERDCEFCYRESNTNGIHMPEELFLSILDQAAEIGVKQIALGGGNPNQHPHFVNFLKAARERNIIPSYTTNGQGMTREIYIATKKYAGAVAVSWYAPYEEAIAVVNQCNNFMIPVNLHFLLSDQNVEEAINFLEKGREFLKKINAIIFLNYKPLGRVTYKGLRENEKVPYLFEKAFSVTECKIGFDSCMISYLTNKQDMVDSDSIDYCEAGRYSAFISEEGFMLPCSFMSQSYCTNTESIALNSIKTIWKNNHRFNMIRHRLGVIDENDRNRSICKDCKEYDFCHGGCPCFDINRCYKGATIE